MRMSISPSMRIGQSCLLIQAKWLWLCDEVVGVALMKSFIYRRVYGGTKVDENTVAPI